MFQKPSNKTDSNNTATKGDPVPVRKMPPTIISSDVRILGNIISESVTDINGRVEGNVTADTVYIREQGVITGDVNATSETHIFGTIHGVIKSPRVCVYASAHIEGAIMHQSITIEDGAYVDAQFKPIDAQPRNNNSLDDMLPTQQHPALQDNLHESQPADDDMLVNDDDDDYDILKDLKLVN